MDTKRKDILTWQKKLLPFMVLLLSALSLFFFIASIYQLYFLQGQINEIPEEPNYSFLQVSDNHEIKKEVLDSLRWKTLVLLETQGIKRRYHQANVMLMSRIWTRYLGFVTGMILTFVGAVFILGKLQESPSQLKAENEAGKFSLTTASPGVLLVVLGTMLMITTLIVHPNIEVEDNPVFVESWYPPVVMQNKVKKDPKNWQTLKDKEKRAKGEVPDPMENLNAMR